MPQAEIDPVDRFQARTGRHSWLPRVPLFVTEGDITRAERHLWRSKRGVSPVKRGSEGSRVRGDAARPCRTVGRVDSSNLFISSKQKKQHPKRGAVFLFWAVENSGGLSYLLQ